MNKKNLIIAVFLYLISLLFLGYYIVCDIQSYIQLSEFGRLFLLGGSCLFIYLGGFFLSKYKNNNKPMKISIWLFFILYLVLLITLTLFDPMRGRNGLNIFDWSKETFNYYINNSVNIIPFKTVLGYIKSIFYGLINISNILFNLIGNIVCLMPLGFFIPLLFKNINTTKKFLLIALGFTCTIELFQFITLSGSCDIDDVILNTLGAVMMYKIFNIKFVNNFIKKIFLLNN